MNMRTCEARMVQASNDSRLIELVALAYDCERLNTIRLHLWDA